MSGNDTSITRDTSFSSTSISSSSPSRSPGSHAPSRSPGSQTGPSPGADQVAMAAAEKAERVKELVKLGSDAGQAARQDQTERASSLRAMQERAAAEAERARAMRAQAIKTPDEAALMRKSRRGAASPPHEASMRNDDFGVDVIEADSSAGGLLEKQPSPAAVDATSQGTEEAVMKR